MGMTPAARCVVHGSVLLLLTVLPAIAADEPPLPFTPRVLSAEEQARVDAEPLGSPSNPVRCERPAGERAYLHRLRCSSGDPPRFDRSGSYGPGPYGTIIDGYRVRCAGSTDDRMVFMDMYHRGYVENRPVPGFTIVPASSSSR